MAALYWLDILPALPLTRGVPVVGISALLGLGPDHATGVISWRDARGGWSIDFEGVERWVRDADADFDNQEQLAEIPLVSECVRVDLDDPQGFAYALRQWALLDLSGDDAPRWWWNMLDNWARNATTDGQRLYLARALAEVTR